MRPRCRLIPLLLAAQLLAGCAPSRSSAESVEQVVAAMRLEPGMHVADLGAGGGEWTEQLARLVGEGGYVFSTEVEERHLEEIRERMTTAGLENYTTVLGTQDETGLPDDCCNVILMRLVYHHFTRPERMQEDLRRALRSDGRLVVVEITTQQGWDRLPDVPEREGHGIAPEVLVEEMEAGGWRAVERHYDWGDEEDHYCVVFERVGG